MEIERKFLVEQLPGGVSIPPGVSIAQGYLAIDDRAEVRVRRAGEEFTLTVKRGRGESRAETEAGIDRANFEDLWPATEGRRVEKVRRRLDLPGGLVAELDLYGGELEGLSVVEVEFGSEEAARDFHPPAWFGRELTGDRAWANQSLALSGKPDKSLEFRLRPGEGPAAGICRVIAARAAQAASAVRQAGTVENPAGQVHEARKSLKKVRSALRLLRGVISEEEREAANANCRDAAAHLSGPRDAEVKIETLGTVAGTEDQTEGTEDWLGELKREASSHRDELNPDRLSDVHDRIEEVRREFIGRELSVDGEAIAGNAGRSYRRGRKAMKRAKKSSDPEAFHVWRKRAKDLRYQLEILEPRLPERFTRVRRAAEDLADKLGDLHDLDVLTEDLVGRGLAETERSRLSVLIAEARDRQIELCLELGALTYDQKPKRFTNRIGEALSDAS